MSFYDVDLYEWPARQAQLLREGRIAEADIETIAEGLDDMSKSQKRELRARLRVLMAHLLKCENQPERRTRSWNLTLRNQRTEIRDQLKYTPSLQAELDEAIREVWLDATAFAAAETDLPQSTFPAHCPWTIEQILDYDFLPNAG